MTELPEKVREAIDEINKYGPCVEGREATRIALLTMRETEQRVARECAEICQKEWQGANALYKSQVAGGLMRAILSRYGLDKETQE